MRTNQGEQKGERDGKGDLLAFWRWVSFYALTLAICMGTMGLLALVIALPNWHLAAVGIWYLVCLASLCFPEDFPDRWLSGRR